jgi:spore coat polysaccharide biosynthesis protein SpsF (cytidylyltransferase family)
MIPAFITVRSTSSRLPQKCFLPFGEVCVLEHIINRTRHYGLEPIICTTTESEDDQIVGLSSRLDVKFFRGSVINKLQRWLDCCRAYRIDAFHSVDADDPFFCGEEMHRSFELLNSGYDMVAPSLSSSGGGATVGYSLKTEILEKTCESLDEDTDTEMMWSYVERVSELKKITLSEPQKAVIRHRMTLDYPEDYVLLEAVRLIVGNLATREQVSEALQNNPDLANINAFRSAEWSENQKLKSITYT